jgi:hypothetical protein
MKKSKVGLLKMGALKARCSTALGRGSKAAEALG